MSAPINTPFSVVAEIRDPDGDVCANGEADVPCVISIDTYPSGSENAVLSGTLTKTPVAGVLTFDDLEIDTEGNGYTLKVEPVTPIDGLVAKVSGSFTVAPAGNLVVMWTANPPYAGQVSYQTGFSGSLTPDTHNGIFIRNVSHGESGLIGFYSLIEFSGSSLPQFSTFSSITVNGNTYTAASATYFAGAGYTQWWWSGATFFPTISAASDGAYQFDIV